MKKIYLVAIFAIVVAFALLLSFSSTKDKGLTTEKEYPYTMSFSDEKYGIETEYTYPYNG